MPQSEQPRSTDRVEPLVADLRDRLRETTEAARRLAGEAREEAADRPPPRGWETPRPGEPRSTDLADLVLLAEQTGALLSELARGVVPAELRRQFLDAVRELLVAVGAVIDWYVERLGTAQRETSVEVEDIPIG